MQEHMLMMSVFMTRVVAKMRKSKTPKTMWTQRRDNYLTKILHALDVLMAINRANIE